MNVIEELHPLALRDACPCAECRHPVSGQRLFESKRVLPDARAVAAEVVDGELSVEWADGHRSIFPLEWVRMQANGGPPARTIRAWGDALPEHEWAAVRDDDSAKRDWLRDAAELGFAVLHGVPVEPGHVERVARMFGAARETNYGVVFDVSVSVGATNLADTSLPLSAHTDNPYREPAPTLQLLHCLESAVDGGNTVLVDGFAAAARLRPDQLDVLASTPIRFAYRDATADLFADVPVVTVGPRGEVTGLHLNNRSKGIPVGDPAAVAAWYAAYLALLDAVESPDLEREFKLAPGDLVLFDNTRILHGRTGFTGEGSRRLQGCYADRDALLSTLAVLEREAA
ncbi:MAG: TauD/TfdA family dioxygenase [Actinobacteria bacterium]|nr:TauD/TfdA family dioxygenase [Actinomycetota bacterium]MBV8478977.1 TauD/TfdA family dioxygenase [Actinomycetota bacterium]